MISPILISILDVAFFARYPKEMKEILRTNDPTLIAFATAMLKGEGIRCFVMDQNISVLEGSIGIFPQRMMVADSDAFIANAVLRDNDIASGLPA